MQALLNVLPALVMLACKGMLPQHWTLESLRQCREGLHIPCQHVTSQHGVSCQCHMLLSGSFFFSFLFLDFMESHLTILTDSWSKIWIKGTSNITYISHCWFTGALLTAKPFDRATNEGCHGPATMFTTGWRCTFPRIG